MTLPLSHRIKGVQKGKGKRGEIIENDPSDKVQVAVRTALAVYLRDKGCSPAVTALEVEDFTVAKKGDLLGRKKKYQNNNYTATGSITYFLREHAGDKVHEKQTSPFSVSFEDTLDGNSLPTLKIVKFELK